MNCNRKEKNKAKIVFLSVFLTTIAILLLTGGLIGCYWPHLLWKYCEWKYVHAEREHLINILGDISNGTMPKIEIPDEWVEHSLDCVQFYLPPDMSSLAERNTSAYFGNENINIHVAMKSQPLQSILQGASQMHPAQKTFLTLSQLRLETCNTKASDFHWSMSRREVLWHTYIISLRSVILPPIYVKFIESFSGQNWDGLLFFSSKGPLILFEWQCISCPVHGTIYFSPMKEEQELDINVVHGIVQSIRVNCSCLQDVHCEEESEVAE